jgi:5'-nucleotidase
VIQKKPLILVTNDDGITSAGIKALVEVASSFGNVYVVAPDKPQSGMGHAITVHSGITVKPIDFDGAKAAFSCSGTPADCVKLGKYHLLKEKPDLCLSGINHGSNVSLNVIYSGTMSAALEGALEGIPSIGFSLCNNRTDVSLDAAKKVTKTIIETFLAQTSLRGTKQSNHNLCLNVNIPDVPYKKIKGIKFCRQGKGNWKEYYEARKNEGGEEFLWLTGKFENFEKKSTDTDLYALAYNYVTVVPINADMTDYEELVNIKNWK